MISSIRYPDKFCFKELKKIRINSGLIRKCIEDWETDYIIRKNNNFPLYVYPKLKLLEKAPKDILLIINGFDEWSSNLYYYYCKDFSLSHLIHKLCLDSALRGKPKSVAILLVPIPFHHWRRPTNKYYENLTSTQMIISKQIRLYLGFEQLLCDIDSLISSNATRYINDRSQIHILGYSLGGLGALGIFLKDKLKGEDRIKNCFLLASGLNIQHIKFSNTVLQAQDENSDLSLFETIERRMKEFYLNAFGYWREELDQLNRHSPEDEDIIKRLFELIVLGYSDYNSVSYRDIVGIWRNYADSVKYFGCKLDNVMDPELISRCVPNGMNPEINKIEKVGHYLQQYREWFKSGAQEVSKIVAESIRNC